MKRFKLLTITGAALVISAVLAGCASFTVVGVDNEATTGPRQIRQYRDIDPKDITVYAFYKDDSRKQYTINARDITFDNSKVGRQTVTVRVSGSFTTSFETEVMALTGITATLSAPVVFRMETVSNPDIPGLVVNGVWNQMGSAVIADPRSYQVRGFTNNRAGRQTLTVEYKGFTDTISVDVRAISSIRVDSPPAKVRYVQGEGFSMAGLVVTGVWDGLDPVPITVNTNMISGFNSNTIGTQRVTITAYGKTATFTVEVVQDPKAILGTWVTTGNSLNSAYTYKSDGTIDLFSEYIPGYWEANTGASFTYSTSGSALSINASAIIDGNASQFMTMELSYSISGNTLTWKNPQTGEVLNTFTKRNISIGAFTPPSSHTPLTNGQWNDDSIDRPNTGKMYSFPVTAGGTYNVWLENSVWTNTGKTCHVGVKALHSDGTKVIDNESNIFNNPKTFVASSNGRVYLWVYPYGTLTGTFGIVYNDNAEPQNPGTRPRR